MTPHLLLTKLHCPTVPMRYVKRPFLTQRLQDGLESGRQLTLISAPAGFGKTTCISEWLSDLNWPVAWISLDKADNDPGRFFAYLVTALQRIDKSLGEELQGIIREGQLPPIEGITTTLINDILIRNKRFLLVLDDMQVIEDRVILQVLEQLVTNLPLPLHLVLITREDPSLPLARLRANNQLTEIRAEDLRFNKEETDTFLREVMALPLSQDETTLLEKRTEGWIVGLQLVGLSIRDRANPTDFITHLSGSHRHILSYLTEEVLHQQPQDIQQFLLGTAVLDKLNGDLCDAVTGGENGRFLLEQLYNANLFLIPLDDNQQWYRYHHLFADLLRNQLQQSNDKAHIQALHRHASKWFRQHQYTDEAIHHALAADDFQAAAALVEEAASPLIFTGQINTVGSWLQQLPEETFVNNPRLAVYRAWLALIRGEAGVITHALQEMDSMLNDLPPSPENDQLRLELTVILCRIVALVGQTDRAKEMAQDALSALPADDKASHARAYSALTIAYGLEGNTEPATAAYQTCLTLAKAANYDSLTAHTSMIVGQGFMQYGQLREAARIFQSIVDLGEKSGQKLFFPAGQGYVGLAEVYLEWHDLDQAASYAQKGIDLCRQGGLAGVVNGLLTQARLLQAQGKLKGALAKLDDIPNSDGSAMVGIAMRQVQLRRAMGDVDALTRWAMPLSVMLSGQFGPLPIMVVETIQLILSRIYLAQGDLDAALNMLADLEETAGAGARNGRLIELNLLRALILKSQGKNVAAQEAFARSLRLAEPENFVLLFLEEGDDVIPLLQAFLSNPDHPQNLKLYAQKLLTTFPGESEHTEQLIEPLSAREQEILNLIGAGYSNQEISEELVITLHTVKKHSSNIYSKLGVNSRTQAVARARELRLL